MIGILNTIKITWEGWPLRRYLIDCRDSPGDENKCTVALAANTKEELLDAVIQHGMKVHGYKDSPDFRKNIVKECGE